MKIGEDLYSSKNILFWIYNYNDEYYLIDNLRHPMLIFLGFYRPIIFKLKARKITYDEMQQYRRISVKKNGKLAIYGGIIASFGTLVSSALIMAANESSIFIGTSFYMFFVFTYLVLFLILLSKYRKKMNFDKLVYQDAIIKVSVKKKKIVDQIVYHFFNFIYFMAILEPFLQIKPTLLNGGISSNDFLTVIFSLIMLTIFSFAPMNLLGAEISLRKII